MANILFLSFSSFKTLDIHDIYADLLREFAKRSDKVYVASAIERKYPINEKVIEEENIKILNVRIDNYFNVSFIRKGLTLLTVDKDMRKGLKKALKDVHIDLVLYATPPIMFVNTINYFKKRGAKTFLLLKDIYPQNAVDVGLMSKGLLYSFFRKKEIQLYKLSDMIGCMSKANVDYVISENDFVNKDKVIISPNAADPHFIEIGKEEKTKLREEYGIPQDKKVFVYGGNLGVPQGIDFIKSCLKDFETFDDGFFLIVGGGTEYDNIKAFIEENKLKNCKLMNKLDKAVYDRFVASCDYGLIFLDHRFTIPNYPSRLISYMEAGLPIVSATDKVSDVGKNIVDGGFGIAIESVNSSDFIKACKEIMSKDYKVMQKNAKDYLLANYTTKEQYENIKKFMESK